MVFSTITHFWSTISSGFGGPKFGHQRTCGRHCWLGWHNVHMQQGKRLWGVRRWVLPYQWWVFKTKRTIWTICELVGWFLLHYVPQGRFTLNMKGSRFQTARLNHTVAVHPSFSNLWIPRLDGPGILLMLQHCRIGFHETSHLLFWSRALLVD